MNDPLAWMTNEVNKNNATFKAYTPRYNKSVPIDRIFRYDTNVVTKNPASVNYMKPFSFDLTYTKMNTQSPKLVDKYLNHSTNKHLRIADRLRKVVGDVKVNRAVDMSSIPSEEQDKVLKILGMTESQLKDTKPENYFGTRIGRTGAKEQVIYNFDLWMQYPVLNQDASHLELNERYKINYAYGSPLVMGSIQARTIWIQKSVYKPINWNDVEKDGGENQRAIVPVQNMPDPFGPTSMPELIPPLEHRTDPYPNPEPEEESSTMSGPTVEIPSSIQITENNIPHAKDELTDREVYELCNELIKGYNFAYENGYEPFTTAFTRFFGKYDKNPSRMRQVIVNAIKSELTKPEMSSEFESLINVFCTFLNESDQAIAKRLFDKINSKRGDIGRDAFWDRCKWNEPDKKYYTDNIEMPIPKGERPLPNTNFTIPAERPPKPTQLPDTSC